MKSHLERYRQVADAVGRHGLGFLVGATGLERVLPFHRGLLGHERRNKAYTRPEHFRLALTELGPTFIKLGQVLSTRADLLPPEYQTELAKLQDAAPPVPYDAIRAAIIEELGSEPDKAFAWFNHEPLASASIGQAHEARLSDGTEVVVKLRRPGAVEQVTEDLEILQNLAARAAQRWEAAADYDVHGVVETFARTLRAELDYLNEGRNAERFSRNFASTADVHIPRIFWETTTSRVLTIERVRGIKVGDVAGLEAAGIDRSELAARATRTTVKMILEDGFFHADPHPGNLFIGAGGDIGLIDFGMVGEIDEELQGRLADLLLALTKDDPDRLATSFIRLAANAHEVDRPRLRHDVVPIVDLYRDRSMAELPVGELIQQVFAVLRRHRLQLPAEVALVLKVFVMAEGMGARLDPDFQLGAVLRPYAERLVARRTSPLAIARRIAGAGGDAAELLAELPHQLKRVREIVDSDGPSVHLRAAELEPLVERGERVGQRLVVALITAAFIRGVGELIALDPRRWASWRLPLVAAGLGAAGPLGAYLAFTGRRRKHGR